MVKQPEFLLAKESTAQNRFWIMCTLTYGVESTPSLGGARYFLSIIDDFSRRVWVYLLKSKGETYSRFVEWKTLVKRKTEKKLKALRTDNGLEFLSGEFKLLC